MYLDIPAKIRGVKYAGQLAQLSSRLAYLAFAAALCGVALTFLVIGLPYQALVCMREVFLGQR